LACFCHDLLLASRRTRSAIGIPPAMVRHWPLDGHDPPLALIHHFLSLATVHHVNWPLAGHGLPLATIHYFSFALFRARENLKHIMKAKKILGKKITDSLL
jgi:hypothetical protein